MANFTPNYNLRKPEDTDDVVVEDDLGDNFDIIDAAMKANADDITAGTPTRAFKSGSTVRTNTVALAADPDLVLPVEAGKFYKVELCLNYAVERSTAGVGAPGGNLKIAFDIAGAPITAPITLFLDTISGISDITNETVIDPVFAGTFNGPSTREDVAYWVGRLQAPASGNLVLTWAQSISNADDTILRAGSFLLLQPIS